MVNASICKIGYIGSNPISCFFTSLKYLYAQKKNKMTARLTNAIGTRLGITHSWKSKMVPNIKTQMLPLFKREQDYNLKIDSLFLKGANVKQSILRGQYIHYYNQRQQTILDVLLYDTAFERIRRNIKHFRKYTAFFTKRGGQYYRLRNIYRLKQKKGFYKHPIFRSLLFPQPHLKTLSNIRKLRVRPQGYAWGSLETRVQKLLLKNKQLKLLYFSKKKPPQVFRRKGTQIRKAVAYFFARQAWVVIHSFYTYMRLLKQRQLGKSTLNVNLISIPKIYVTHKMIMAFIIKRLYLNYNLYEIIRQFKKFFKLRTAGYTLRGCGKLTKKQRAWYIKRHERKTKINNLSEYVTYAYSPASLRYGNVGIKLWINY